MKKFIKSLFLPHEGNNFKAKLIQPSFLSLIVAILLLNQSIMNLVVLAKPGVLGYSSDITPDSIVELTNKERQKQGLPPLKINPLLSEAARRKAADMFAFNYWSHTSPSGRSPWYFFKEGGYNYVVAGENLAKDFSNPEGVVTAWMKSPTHRANIVDARFKEIGVAVVDGTLKGYQTTLVVQLFGTRSAYASEGEKNKKRKTLLAYSQQVKTDKTTPESVYTRSGSVIGGEKKVPINPLSLTKGLSMFLFGIVIGVLLVDAYYVIKNRVHRLSGKSLAHAGFLMVILLMILLSQQGMVN
jgi:hypothetical protein